MNNTQQRIKDKLSASAVYTLMKAFQDEVSLYPPAYIECKKQKREDAVVRASNGLYAYHTAFTSSLNDYGNSVVLVANDMVLPYMAKEVATFTHHLEQFTQAIKKANSVPELKDYYAKFTLKPKQLMDALIEDAKAFSEQYGFTVDVKELVSSCKAHKQELSGK